MADPTPNISIREQRELMRRQQGSRRRQEQKIENRPPLVQPIPKKSMPKRSAVGVPSSPVLRQPASTQTPARPSVPAVAIKPPMTELPVQPPTTEAERAAALGSAQQRERNAKPGGGETGQRMLSEEGGVGVLPTIPASYGAVPEEEKDIRKKERTMIQTQEQLLGPAPIEARPPTEEQPKEEERGRRETERAGALTADILAQRAAEQEKEEEAPAAGAAQAGGVDPIILAQKMIRSEKLVLLFSIFGIPLYALLGTIQLFHKLIGCPFGKQFKSALWEDAIALLIDAAIAAVIFITFYGCVAIIGAVLSVPGAGLAIRAYSAVSSALH